MLKVGTRVLIMHSGQYDNSIAHTGGFIRSRYELTMDTKKPKRYRYGVEIPGFYNRLSDKGLFWFYEDALFVVSGDDPKQETLNNIDIKKVIFSGPKTIILWKDGTKTIVSCNEDDRYDEYAGFCAAVTKKVFGTTSNAKKVMDSHNNDYYTMKKLSEELSKLENTLEGEALLAFGKTILDILNNRKEDK